jgi:hypothetical protein
VSRRRVHQTRSDRPEEAGFPLAVLAQDDVPIALEIVFSGRALEIESLVREALDVPQMDALDVHALTPSRSLYQHPRPECYCFVAVEA